MVIINKEKFIVNHQEEKDNGGKMTKQNALLNICALKRLSKN